MQYLIQFSSCSLPWKKDLSGEQIHITSAFVPPTNCNRNEWPNCNHPVDYMQCANLVSHFSFYRSSSLTRYFIVVYLLITAWVKINGGVIKSERSTLERLCHKPQSFIKLNRNILSFRHGGDQEMSNLFLKNKRVQKWCWVTIHRRDE